MHGLVINSDFKDYYDEYCDSNSNVVYNRFYSNSMQRGTALNKLRGLGLKTLDVKQVSSYFSGDGYIVVYTNPKLHNGCGKRIMTVNEALQSYGNCLASPYIFNNGLTVKYMQIGKRRFNLYFQKGGALSLDIGTLIKIEELPSDYNRLIGIPIFSIDYISDGTYMIATDFNEVENLSMLGLNNYIGPHEVISEIIETMHVYNKVL